MKKLKTYESFEPEEEWLEEEDVEIGDIFVIDPKDWDSFVEFLKKNGVHEWNGIENINKPLHEPYHNKTYRGKYYILILDNRKIYTLAYWLSEKNGIFKINVRVIFDYSHTVIEEYTIDISKSKKFIPLNESFEPEEYWEEEEDTIPKELESFLKDNNCYEEYVEAAGSEYSSTIRKRWKHPSDLNEFYEKTDRMGWISYCFEWSETPGGDNLWEGIHMKWIRHLKSNQMNESFEPEEEWEEEETDLRLTKWGDSYHILEKITYNGVIVYNNYNHYMGSCDQEKYFSYVNKKPHDELLISVFDPDFQRPNGRRGYFIKIPYGELEESIKNRILYL